MMLLYNENTIKSVNDLLYKLINERDLGKKEYKELLEKTHAILSSKDDKIYNVGLSVICHVAEKQPQDLLIKQLLHDCIVASRVFLYKEMLVYENNLDIDYTNFDYASMAYYQLETGTVLTKDQKKLVDDFQKYRRLIVSAPTSFGKSRIISEIIARNKYESIAVILPTIALLNETYIKFKNNKFLKEYTLITSLAQPIEANDKKIFIFTPEKMDMLLDQNPEIAIDFFVFDEIYKIQDDEDRRKIFTYCLYRMIKMDSDFYLIGPYFEGFSEMFMKKTKAKFRKYEAEIVQKKTIDLSSAERGFNFNLEGKNIRKYADKDRNLINIINALDGQTLVYLGQKQRVENRAKKLAEVRGTTIDNPLIDYIRENIHKDWSLAKFLEKGVAFHHGAIPKHIQSEIVDYFNDGKIDVLFCTSTLTEGVNTTAKNVIIYDDFKGRENNKLSGFDVKNIKGRAGRFLEHFVGRVVTMEKVNDDENKGEIEFSYYDNGELEIEDTIQMDTEDLDGKNLVNRESIEKELKNRDIPFELIKRNKFIPIFQQIKLIQHLRSNPNILRKISFNGNFPEKEQLEEILIHCHGYLFSDKDKGDRTITIGNLLRLTKYYVYISPSLKELINNQNGASVDTQVRTAFYLVSQYFEFALPRYLTVFEGIFNFVSNELFGSKKTINLKPLITKLEFGFVNPHEIALKEAGLPVSVINKISSKFSDCMNISEIKMKVSIYPYLLDDLSLFEKNLFRKYI